MDTESIDKQIQAENDSYYRDLNRLQQKILDLKQIHQRTMENLKRQKQLATNQNTNENFLKSVTVELYKFL